MDKVEATATVRDFDPISGSIPATKVEITVSCRWVRSGADAAVSASGFGDLRALPKLVCLLEQKNFTFNILLLG